MKHRVIGFILIGLMAVAVGSSATAQQNLRQERLVANAMLTPVNQLPGVRLVRKGDSLLLAVRLINDSLEPERRRDELIKTLDNMLEAAASDESLELSIVDQEGYIAPVNSIDQNIAILGSTESRGMSHIDIRLKTAIPEESIDGQALVKRLRGFVESTEKVGRTVVTATGKIDISILNPEQYRTDIIKLITAEIKLVTGELGDDYKVILQDLEKPLEWRRVGIVDLELYIPYRFRVIPGTVTSVNM